MEFPGPFEHISEASRYQQTPQSESVLVHSGTFQYSELNTPSTQIRLFRICTQKKPGQRLRCAMTKHSLPISSDTIYRAISYTWQPEHPYQEIRINHRTHRIGYNLWRALKNFHEAGETGLLWADALCINQDDLEERNAQVSIMGQIYKNAHEVLCWAGEADRGSRELSRDLSGDIIRDVRSGKERLTQRNRHLEMLERLSDREYWSRTWIVPEILSQPRSQVIIFCGSSFIDLEALHGLCNLLLFASEPRCHGATHKASARGARHRSRIWNSKMLHLSHKWLDTSLWDLLRRHGGTKCSNPRDKVYALLSVAEDTASLDCALQPDYAKDVQTLITDVLVFCGRQDRESLEQLIEIMAPGEKVPRSYAEWARKWPADIVL